MNIIKKRQYYFLYNTDAFFIVLGAGLEPAQPSLAKGF